MKGDQMTFELCYEFADERLVSRSELRFLRKEEIEKLLTAAGLHIEKLFGNWDSTPFVEEHSEEMIFFVRAS